MVEHEMERVALITGAAGGIGRAIALSLGRVGYKLVLTDLDAAIEDTQKEMQALGMDVIAVTGDVADYGLFEEAIVAAKAQYGSITILVNNAGITNNIAKTDKMPIAAWQRELDVNLTGFFYGCRSTLPMMCESHWGRIVNISSVAALNGLDRQVGYAASKAGILGLTQTIALEYAAMGITCNAVLPGMIATRAVLSMPKALKQQTTDLIPAARFGVPADVANLVTFLVSDLAGYITGAAIPVDGGAHCNPITLARMRTAPPK